MSILKPISISLSPNTERDDVWLAFKLLFQPWHWNGEAKSRQLEEELKNYLGVDYAISFNSGRSALMAILEVIGVKKGDEVLLQGFTCNSAVNPILEKKVKPVYVDIDDTLNLDPVDLQRKITSRSKAVMVQHNFGWPAQIGEISRIARENNLFLIEDCAHSLGAKYKGKLCGTFGEAAFFSFGRDKVISSVFGGMAVANDKKIGESVKRFQEKLDYPSFFWTFQQLLHPVLMNWKILPAYALHPFLGRIIMGVFHKAGILSKAVYKEEKKGKMGKYFPKLLANAFAILALNQFKKLEKFNNHRRKIADFYQEQLTNLYLPLNTSQKEIIPVFMRYPVLLEKETEDVLKESRKKRIFLDDGWRKTPIIPRDTDIKKMDYSFGSCPRAEKVSEHILNLPTSINISKEDAQKIVDFIKKYGS